MKKVLIHNQPKRLFTFGCSFTGYNWGTWANVLAKELEPIEFYNFGRAGAGNHYIFNILMQADAMYNFTHEDLVIVQWTNVSREDRYTDEWLTPGNIYSQKTYDLEFVRKYFTEYGASLRDYAFIKSAHEMLKHKTQWHFLQMLDITAFKDQWDLETKKEDIELNKLHALYHETLENLIPSFYDVLYSNQLKKKFKQDSKLINRYFKDGHPNPFEHYAYLKEVFKHDWKDTTDAAVSEAFDKWKKLLQDAARPYEIRQEFFNVYKMNERWMKMFFYETKIVAPSQPDNRLTLV